MISPQVRVTRLFSFWLSSPAVVLVAIAFEIVRRRQHHGRERVRQARGIGSQTRDLLVHLLGCRAGKVGAARRRGEVLIDAVEVVDQLVDGALAGLAFGELMEAPEPRLDVGARHLGGTGSAGPLL
jgi:hypothetical protein